MSKREKLSTFNFQLSTFYCTFAPLFALIAKKFGV